MPPDRVYSLNLGESSNKSHLDEVPVNQPHPIRADIRDELVGKTLRGEYRIDALLGAGGMGRVYRARQLGVDRDVVIKVMIPPTARAEEWNARFMEEARAASRVRHPGIVTIYSFGAEEGVGLFIAMEYVDGTDLREVLASTHALEPERACHLMAQVCRAMGEAHASGVVHRDLKPDNIMIEMRAGEEVARVLDFGIAKPEDSAVTTLDEHVVGTPEYMAPEQARKNPVDPRMDVYSAGIILYELVFGRRPFYAPDPLTLMFKHVQQPLPLDDFSEAWPAQLRAILEKACAKDPRERYETAREMADALDACFEHASARRAAVSVGPITSPELGGMSSGELGVDTPRSAVPLTNPAAAAAVPATSLHAAVPDRRPAYLALAALAGLFVVIATLLLAAGGADEPAPTIAVEPAAAPAPPIAAPAAVPAPAPHATAVELAIWNRRVALERARGVAEGLGQPVHEPVERRAAPRAPQRDRLEIHRVAPPEPKRPPVLQPAFD